MTIDQGRQFMKSGWDRESLHGTDQANKVPAPPFEDAFDETALIALPDPQSAPLAQRDIVAVMAGRRSRRLLDEQAPISAEALSFLLWATQGVREVKGGRIFRTVPGAGSRHPYETYLYISRVTGFAPGIYRYIGTRNALLPVRLAEPEVLQGHLTDAMFGQWFHCAVALFWVCNPYRAEWRYADCAHKMALLDAGHIAQNGYLAAEALGLGCCAIGAYVQEPLDALLGVDGSEEFTCYAAVFGVEKG